MPALAWSDLRGRWMFAGREGFPGVLAKLEKTILRRVAAGPGI